MALPILETVTYELELPSSGKTVTYRPFLVKEEKSLMTAQESKSERQIMNTLIRMVEACTFEKLAVKTLPMYDLEALFLAIRTKSVGSLTTIGLECEHCKHTNEIELDLDEVAVKKPAKRPDNKIQLTKDVGITLRDIGVSDMLAMKSDDSYVETLMAVIDSIYTDDEVHTRDQLEAKELRKFVESLAHPQVVKIMEYVESAPKVAKDVEFECSKCSKETKLELSGIQSFFG
jgi:DNA-directed RNA polymerase subunit M/transcription elongation factor TFIIS